MLISKLEILNKSEGPKHQCFRRATRRFWGGDSSVPFDGQIFRLRFAPLKMTTRETVGSESFGIR